MFRKVLVGVDRHTGGRDAICLARTLVGSDGELLLAHVYPDEVRSWLGSSLEYESRERKHARKLLRQVRERAGVEARLRYKESSSVGRGLHQLAKEVGADLLVVGSSLHGLVARVCVGDDSRIALSGAPCAVAIAPAGYGCKPVALQEIGVGYNGTPESRHALDIGRTLAAEHRVKLSAFEVLSLPGHPLPVDRVALDRVLKNMAEAERARVAKLGSVEAHVAYGNPAEELVLYSASLDLLILGSRDYGPIGRLVHGSIAQHLARSSRCPLLVLNRAARAANVAGNDTSDPSRAGLAA
jgi:nucleotide-binding universal stress UspA family protein